MNAENDNQNNDNQNKVRITGEPSSNPNGNITHVNGRVDGAPNPTPFGYTITFVVGKIDGNGQRTWNTYSIDPKLRIVGS